MIAQRSGSIASFFALFFFFFFFFFNFVVFFFFFSYMDPSPLSRGKTGSL
jgi:hypothetical protein